MLRVITWCAKCLFLYCLVAVAAIRFSWVFTTPVWQLATRMHWTNLNRISYVLSYFLPIYAVAGFLLGLIPFGKLGEAIRDLLRSLSNSPSTELVSESDAVPPILWAWLPVTLAFLIRFVSWRSTTSSVFDAHRSTGRLERFFGPLYGQNAGLLDDKWITDRFLFTGPMLFLIACAVAALLRSKLTAPRKSHQEPFTPDSE
ncbi:hypothetical protein RBB77_05530 [Tunturibacter psychrotolerans]|uniref:Uncharacterized protein n=1 Tax=Tunturiibacter psychrotolerans TaxID=3069686 RepID=A0AAU7ZTS4_9BACT